MVHYVFIALFFLMMLPLSAKDDKGGNTPNTITMKGKVVDVHSGEALTGVRVQLAGTKHKVYTDFEGGFIFENLSQGEYHLATEYISYEPKLTGISEYNGRKIVIKLDQL